MGIIFKNSVPSFSGSIELTVPTKTYSGIGAAGEDQATNPYTGFGPAIPGIPAWMLWTGTKAFHKHPFPATSLIETSALANHAFLLWDGTDVLHLFTNPTTSDLETSALANHAFLTWDGTDTLHLFTNPTTSDLETSALANHAFLTWDGTT